jgi:hypothetical protein
VHPCMQDDSSSKNPLYPELPLFPATSRYLATPHHATRRPSTASTQPLASFQQRPPPHLSLFFSIKHLQPNPTPPHATLASMSDPSKDAGPPAGKLAETVAGPSKDESKDKAGAKKLPQLGALEDDDEFEVGLAWRR